MLKKIVYVLVWSFGLFWATFRESLEGRMDFDFKKMSVSDFFDNYMFPLLMVLLLYMADVIYTFHLEGATGGPKKPNLVYLLTAGFLLSFVLSVHFGGTFFALLFFCLAWVCLMAMKFFKTELRAKPTPLRAIPIRED